MTNSNLLDCERAGFVAAGRRPHWPRSSSARQLRDIGGLDVLRESRVVPLVEPIGHVHDWQIRSLRALKDALTSVANAASISRVVLALRTWICSPMAGAAAATSLNIDSVYVALVGLTSTAMRTAAGTTSRRSSSRFAANSTAKKLTPVRLPPGRARLVTRPSLTGSSATTKTIGIVAVAALAAKVEGKPPVAITATRRCANSAASAGSRSN